VGFEVKKTYLLVLEFREGSMDSWKTNRKLAQPCGKAESDGFPQAGKPGRRGGNRNPFNKGREERDLGIPQTWEKTTEEETARIQPEPLAKVAKIVVFGSRTPESRLRTGGHRRPPPDLPPVGLVKKRGLTDHHKQWGGTTRTSS